MRTAYLSGGRSSWALLRDRLPGWTGLWQDRDGLHVQPLPTAAPFTSWLWGWSPDGAQLLRCRLDGEQVHAALLSLAPAADAEPVTAVVHQAEPWAAGDGRVGQVRGPGAAQLGSPWALVEVPDIGSGPLEFQAPAATLPARWATA